MRRSSLTFFLVSLITPPAAFAKPLDNAQPSKIDPERVQIERARLRSADLESKINYLLDRAEIEDLVSAYAYSVDLRDWTLHKSLFTDTYQDGTSGTFRTQTAEKRVELLENYFPQFEGTQHLNIPLYIQIEGDEAFAISTLSTRHFHSDGTPDKNTLLTGQYEFSCTRSPSGWKIKRISLVNRRKLATPQNQP